MKILHTADWHLGNVFHRHGREEEHRHFLQWLLNVLTDEQPDALFIAGDVFDHANPSAVAERQLYDFLIHATQQVEGLQVVLIAGNHDGAARLEAPSSILGMHRVFVRGLVHRLPDGQIDFDRHVIPLHSRLYDRVEALCLAIPYLRSCDYPEGFTAQEGMRSFLQGVSQAAAKSRYAGVPLMAVAHFYATGAEINDAEHSERLVVGGQDCVDLSKLGVGKLSYVALGHIHKAQRVGGREEVRYSGSALPMSFGERGYRHGVVCVELDEQGQAQIRQLPYEPLRALWAVPASGCAEPDELLREVSRLPRVGKSNADDAAWPYLELRVHQNVPDPSLQNRLFEALADKAVHYCRTVSVSDAPVHEDEHYSLQGLQQTSPLELAGRFYRQRYNEDMPESLQQLFRQAQQDMEQQS